MDLPSEPVAMLIQTVFEVSAVNEVGRDSDFVCWDAKCVCGKTQEFLLFFCENSMFRVQSASTESNQIYFLYF